MKPVKHHARQRFAAKNVLIVLFLLVFLGGLIYALYPLMTGVALMQESRRTVEIFIHTLPANLPSSIETLDEHNGSSDEQMMETLYPELLASMRVYNERIYSEGQSSLTDARAYTEPSFDLTEYGLESEVIGILSIPSINLEMPIYLGATYDHMAKGAAHLSQTSLPIGGENTNCVIAGHRGWQGAPYFLYLDKIVVGDEVTITNLWETLTYKVCEIRVIEPNDIEAVLIQPGRDMLTLITCHPYASGGKYRLVVYSDRIDPKQQDSFP